MIIPAILEDNPETVQKDLNLLAQLEPQPQVVQIDIIDGEFARNLTLDTEQLAQLDTGEFLIDVHLMTLDPTDYVHEIRAGKERGQNIRTVIAQIERLHSVEEFLEEVEANHLSAGLALDLHTPVSALEQRWLSRLQVVQVMGGKAGEQGQDFQPSVLDKIRELAWIKQGLPSKNLSNTVNFSAEEAEDKEDDELEPTDFFVGGKTQQFSFQIGVDIGMNLETIPQVQDAGAEFFVVGSGLRAEAISAKQKKWEQFLELDPMQE